MCAIQWLTTGTNEENARAENFLLMWSYCASFFIQLSITTSKFPFEPKYYVYICKYTSLLHKYSYYAPWSLGKYHIQCIVRYYDFVVVKLTWLLPWSFSAKYIFFFYSCLLTCLSASTIILYIIHARKENVKSTQSFLHYLSSFPVIHFCHLVRFHIHPFIPTHTGHIQRYPPAPP